MNYLMTGLILISPLTACNWGVVDVQTTARTCYNITTHIGDHVWRDSVAFDCSEKDVTSPFEPLLKPFLPK